MDTILVVEDQYAKSDLTVDICKKWTDSLKVAIATDEDGATGILEKNSIAMMIVDLSSGYGLHAEHLEKLMYKFPYIPVIAITNKEQNLKRTVLGMGASLCLHSPLSPSDFKRQVDRLLKKSINGILHGIPLYSLLQMLESNNTTCTLKISSSGLTGYIYLENGAPIAAEVDGLLHEEALYAIVVWEEANIEILHYNGQRTREIEKPLISLLIEAFRLKDEQSDISRQKAFGSIQVNQLQPLPTAGNRLALEMGAKVNIEFDPTGTSVTCTVVGVVPNLYVVVIPPEHFTPPTPTEKKPGQVNIKYLHMGQLCMFRTILTEETHSPQHLLFFEYPHSIQIRELRRAKRSTTFVPVKLKYDGESTLPGVLTDLSSLGCHFSTTIEDFTSLPQFDIESSIELDCFLPSISERQVVQGVIKNIQKSSSELDLGIHFVNLPKALQKTIENYTFSAERLNSQPDETTVPAKKKVSEWFKNFFSRSYS